MTSMMSSCNTSTLTIAGIVWHISKMHGRIAFFHGNHIISFNPWSSHYQIKEGDETVFASRSVSECLENSAEIVFDYYADRIVPSWEAN